MSNSLDNILIVSGGGAGQGAYTNYQGSGGGYIGVTASGTGGSQLAGGTGSNQGTFGKGGNCSVDGGGGGGGFYGGGGASSDLTGGGGSGYIGNSLLSNKSMYCYNCTESDEESTKTISNTCSNTTATENCSKQGNGYAKITLVSIE